MTLKWFGHMLWEYARYYCEICLIKLHVKSELGPVSKDTTIEVMRNHLATIDKFEFAIVFAHEAIDRHPTGISINEPLGPGEIQLERFDDAQYFIDRLRWWMADGPSKLNAYIPYIILEVRRMEKNRGIVII